MAPIDAETQAAINFDDCARAEHGRYFCRRCADSQRLRAACERYSMGCYAGMLCDECWAEDGRNHDRQFDEADAGETLEPDTWLRDDSYDDMIG